MEAREPGVGSLGKNAAQLPFSEIVGLNMSSDHTLHISGDSRSQSTDSNSDGDLSVDFGLPFPDGIPLNAACFRYDAYDSAHDSTHDCYLTERTKHHASQSSYGTGTCSKKPKLEYLEPELKPPATYSNSEEIRDSDAHDCCFTEKTKCFTSQSSYGVQTSCKKPALYTEEFRTSTASWNSEDSHDSERPDVQNGKILLYAGQEIFGTWILQSVRIA